MEKLDGYNSSRTQRVPSLYLAIVGQSILQVQVQVVTVTYKNSTFRSYDSCIKSHFSPLIPFNYSLDRLFPLALISLLLPTYPSHSPIVFVDIIFAKRYSANAKSNNLAI